MNAERQTKPTEKSWLAEQRSFCVRSALVSRRAVRAMERSFCAARKIGMRALSESRRAAESAALSPARLVSRVGVATRAAARVGDWAHSAPAPSPRASVKTTGATPCTNRGR